jgi:uncharacterized protein (TIGR00159 family)
MLSFTIKDAIDVLLVALLLYYIFRLMKESRSGNIFMGIIVFIIIWIFVSKIFNMSLLGSIMDKAVNLGAIALIIIFQDDIRNFFSQLGAHHSLGKLVKFFYSPKKGDAINEDTIIPVVRACMSMSAQKVGALIVFERYVGLGDIEKTGDIINADIRQRLIENIFFKNSPLHDGAMIIAHHKIRAAGCILPVSHDEDIPRRLGLRHRAALGITQQSDAVAVIVSEETGGISVAFNGRFHLDISGEELERILTEMSVG